MPPFNPLATLGFVLFGLTIVVFAVAESASHRYLRTVASLGLLSRPELKKWEMSLFFVRWGAVFNLLDETSNSSLEEPELLRLELRIRRLSRVGVILLGSSLLVVVLAYAIAS